MQLDEYGAPVMLESGVRCGSHGFKTYHDSVEAVRACYAMMYEETAQQQAELAAEMAYERHLEDRGWQEAMAERAWEDSRGVIQFDQAYRDACPELFADER